MQAKFVELTRLLTYNDYMEQKHFESLYPETARDREIDELVGFIKEGNSSQLIGLSGSGRSNVLGLLAYNTGVRLRHFPKNHGIVHFVLVNFSEIKMRPYAEVVKFILLCLDSSLRERGMQEEYERIDSLFKEALAFNDELILAQALKQAIDYLAVEKKLTVILLFNQFDDYIPQVTGELFTLLRSLRDLAKYRFSAIFSVTRPLEDTLEPELLTQFGDFLVGHAIYLALYDMPSVSFRIAYLEKLTGKKLSDDTKAELIKLTGGHMRLIKNSTEAVLASENGADLENLLMEQLTVQAALKSIWRDLTPSEQAYLASGSREKESPHLNLIGLVREDKITIPLFARALKEGLFKEYEGSLVYDETTNTIKRGEELISNSLTRAEFRLLRHLLQHPDEIIEREDVITSVWKEDRAIAGISEQAIDQLIFRLRRKIEADPSNPTHILTIKGRGIKYTPLINLQPARNL